jgi:hypothetical protein
MCVLNNVSQCLPLAIPGLWFLPPQDVSLLAQPQLLTQTYTFMLYSACHNPTPVRNSCLP